MNLEPAWLTEIRRKVRSPEGQKEARQRTEAEALALAIDWLRQSVQGDFVGLGVPPFWSGRPLMRRLLKQFAMSHPFNLDCVIAWTVEDGSTDAAEALDELVAEYLARSPSELPPQLATYSIRMRNPRLRPPLKKRGRKKSEYMMQDLVIFVIMHELVERFQLLPTRSRFGNRDGWHCAASIIALAVKEVGLKRGGEEGLRKVWDRFAPSILPGTVANALIPVLREQRKENQQHRVGN